MQYTTKENKSLAGVTIEAISLALAMEMMVE